MKNCQICDKPAKVHGKCKNVYNKTGGDKLCITELKKQTKIAIYGNATGINYEKLKILIKKKYGVDNISQLSKIKEKKKIHV